MLNLTAAKPDQVEIVKRNDDGSGVVRIPLIKANQSIDLSKTASGSKGKWEVKVSDLREMVRNFAEYPGPVPIGVSPHVDYDGRSGAALAFVEAVSLDGDALLGDLWLCAGLMYEVAAGHWRGFSGEFARNMDTPTKKLEGWCVFGGVFTNRPATDSNFKVAAESVAPDEVATSMVALALTSREKGMVMAEPDLSVRLATAEAKVTAGEERVVALEAKVKEQRDEIAVLSERADKAERAVEGATAEAQTAKVQLSLKSDSVKDAQAKIVALEEENKSLRVKLQASERATLSDRVKRAVSLAIREGRASATFEGYEKDPAAWLESTFGTFENLERVIAALPKDAHLSASTSGRTVLDDADGAAVSPEVAANLERLGLNPALATARNEAEMRAVLKGK